MTVSNNDQPIDIKRRKALGTLGAFSALGLIGCGGGSSLSSSSLSSALV